MSTVITKTALSEPRRRLVELMQALYFGRIEELSVRDGDPVLEPPPRRVREVKFAAEHGLRPELAATDFLLKVQVVELFQLLDQLREGVLQVIEVKHGLPFRVLVAEGDV